MTIPARFIWAAICYIAAITILITAGTTAQTAPEEIPGAEAKPAAYTPLHADQGYVNALYPHDE